MFSMMPGSRCQNEVNISFDAWAQTGRTPVYTPGIETRGPGLPLPPLTTLTWAQLM